MTTIRPPAGFPIPTTAELQAWRDAATDLAGDLADITDEKETYTLRLLMIGEHGRRSPVAELYDDEPEYVAWLCPRDRADEMAAAVALLKTARDRGYDETITDLALAASLCPLHFVDYAICFDDQDPECAAIRAIHPGHDT